MKPYMFSLVSFAFVAVALIGLLRISHGLLATYLTGILVILWPSVVALETLIYLRSKGGNGAAH